MIAAALLCVASAHESGEPPALERTLGDFTFGFDAALGAQWLPYVGDDSALTRYDVAATEGARIAASALELRFEGPAGSGGGVRVEEGTVHAGGLESAEAWLSLDTDLVGVWVGRTDLIVSRDRAVEPEGLWFTSRPLLSRASLPIHVGGAGLELRWPERAALLGGVSYPAGNADAPYLWARAALHPLGPLPGSQHRPTEGLRVELGGAALRHASPSLGTSLWFSADAELRWRALGLGFGWQQLRAEQLRQGLFVEAGAVVLRAREADLHLSARGERLTGLEAGEDARLLATGRVAWRLAGARVQVYAEGTLSRERGPGVLPEDVVALDPSAERANDALALGMLFSW